MRRVFISAPGDLEADRDACRAALSQVNEASAMPERILLVPVGLTRDDQIVGFRAAASENVRAAAYFIQIFEDDWGPKNLFRKLFYLATECRENAETPMSEVVTFLKDAPKETDPEVLAFRKELEDRRDVRVLRYRTLDELQAHLTEISQGWVVAIRSDPAHAEPAAQSQ